MEKSTTADAPRTARHDGAVSRTGKRPRCRLTSQPTIGPGKGPHHASARCRHCGAFIQWISAYPPAARQARRQAARDDWLARKPPSPLQLAYLTALGHVGPPPASMLEASQSIDRLTGKVQP